MKYGLGKILEASKKPQIEDLGTTDLTSFMEVIQILVTGDTLVAVSKQGKVVSRDSIREDDPEHKTRSVRQLIRRAVANFDASVGYLSFIKKADKGLLVEVVSNEELPYIHGHDSGY